MNKRVLLVEDDPAWQELLTEMLVDMGFTPRRASSYRNAVDALDEGPYTLAVLDVSLVGSEHDNRDGLRLLEQVRTRY
ncbi:MAG: response regulator, partial [Chloroflexota bacterium]|nr:response regulator [Chloroflexota bacterium]